MGRAEVRPHQGTWFWRFPAAGMRWWQPCTSRQDALDQANRAVVTFYGHRFSNGAR